MYGDILDEAGVSSYEELLQKIDEIRSDLADLEKQGRSGTLVGRNLMDESDILMECKEKYDAMVTKDAAKRPAGEDLELDLHDLFIEAAVSDYYGLLNACVHAAQKGQEGENDLARLLGVKASCEQLFADIDRQYIAKILEDCGVGSVEDMRVMLTSKQSDLQNASSSRRLASMQTLVAGLTKAMDRINEIENEAHGRERAGTDVVTKVEQIKAEQALLVRDMEDNLPYYIDIFHDVENCLCEASRKLIPRKVYEGTIREILTAFLSRDMRGTPAWTAAREKVRQMDIEQRVQCNWRFCIFHDDKNPYHPSSAFIDGMRVCQVTTVLPGKKADGADTELKRLMSQFRRGYQGRSQEAKDRTMAVVMSADSDFSNSIIDMRDCGIPVMLIYDPAKISDVHSSSVRPYFSLGIWQDILSASSSHSQQASSSLTIHSNDTIQDNTTWTGDAKYLSALFDLATFIFTSAEGDCCDMSDLDDFRTDAAAAYDMIQSFPGQLRGFCNKSNGAIVRKKASKGREVLLSVCIPCLIRFYVASEGGRLRLSRLGEFYNMFYTRNKAVCDRVKDIVKTSGKAQGMADATQGKMIFERHHDESIGFGYFVCVDNAQAEFSSVVNITWPQYYYLTKYKQEVDSKLAEVVQNYALILDIDRDGTKKQAFIRITLTCDPNRIDADDNGSVAGDDIKSILDNELVVTKQFINDLLKGLETTCKGTARASGSHVILKDDELQRLLKEYKMYCYFFNVDSRSATDEVVMCFPASWAESPVPHNPPNQHTSPPGRHHAFSPARNVVKISVYQHLANEGINCVDMISSVNIIDKPTMHAKLSLTSKAVQLDLKTKLLKSESHPGVKFGLTYESAECGDDNKDLNFILIYPKQQQAEAACASDGTPTMENIGKVAVLKRIEELSITVCLWDIFPKSEAPESQQRRPHNEWFFFTNRVWNFVSNELIKMAPDLLVAPIHRLKKTIVRLEGPEHLLTLAKKYFMQRTNGLLYEYISIKGDQRCQELTDLLNRGFSDIFTTTKNVDETDSRPASTRTPEAQCYRKTAGPVVIGVSIVALPERRQQWQALVRTSRSLITTFRKKMIDMTGHQPNTFNKRLKEFTNMSFSYDKTTKKLTVAGATESVEAAERYIMQCIADENPVSRTVDCMDMVDGRRLCRFFKLECMELELLRLRKELAGNFLGKDRRERVSCEVTSDSDHVTVLQLVSPQEIVDEAVQFAKAGLARLAEGVQLRVMDDLKVGEIEWLQTHAGEALTCGSDLVIDMYTPNCQADNEDANIKCRCKIGNMEILVVCCDFLQTGTTYGCDTIVNSANSQLSHGSGIALAIANAAGPGMLYECNLKSVPVGCALTTGSHQLMDHGIAHVVHAVVPRITQTTHFSRDIRNGMASAVKSALMEATGAGSVGVAIPGLGMGVFGWSVEDAANVIVSAVSNWTEHIDQSPPGTSQSSIRRIVLFDQDSVCAEGFVQALKAAADGIPSSGAMIDSPVDTILAPLTPPELPTHQWLWTLWEHEVNDKSPNSWRTHQNDDGKVCRVIPYDYDQNMLIEGAWARGDLKVEIDGDLNGVQNSKTYSINLQHCTQTTIPERNEYSVRPLYRVPLHDPVKQLPIYKEYLDKYQVDMARLQDKTACGVSDQAQDHSRQVICDLSLGPFLASNIKFHSNLSHPTTGIVLFGKQINDCYIL